jgi:hypothetical protein
MIMLAHVSFAVACLLAVAYSGPLSIGSLDDINYELLGKFDGNAFSRSIDSFYLGGGFEGDMFFPDGFDPTIDSTGRGVAIFGPRQWPNNVVPYDISLITGMHTHPRRSLFH